MFKSWSRSCPDYRVTSSLPEKYKDSISNYAMVAFFDICSTSLVTIILPFDIIHTLRIRECRHINTRTKIGASVRPGANSAEAVPTESEGK